MACRARVRLGLTEQEWLVVDPGRAGGVRGVIATDRRAVHVEGAVTCGDVVGHGVIVPLGVVEASRCARADPLEAAGEHVCAGETRRDPCSVGCTLGECLVERCVARSEASVHVLPPPPKPFMKLASDASVMDHSTHGPVGEKSRYLSQAMTVKPFAIAAVCVFVISSAPAASDIPWVVPSKDKA